MIRYSLLIVFFILILYSGVHSSDYRILENLAFTNATSFDLIRAETDGEEEEKLQVVNSIPKADPEARKGREILEVIANTSKEARTKMSRKTNRIVVSGQLRTALFGTELAKEGIWKHIDTLVRDPSISQRLRLAVVNGNAGELLKQEYPAYPDTGTYLFELLLKEAASHNIPVVNLYHFTRDYFDDGIDPIAPVLKTEKNSLSIEGIGLFQHDMYVAKIPNKQALIFAMLQNNFRRGDLSIELSEQEYLLFSSVVSQQKLHARKTSTNQYEADFYIKTSGSLLEYIGPKTISEPSDQELLEKEVEDYITKEAEALIAFMQKAGADSFGIGQIVRNSSSADEWYGMEWHSVYPHVKVRVHVDIEFKDHGKFQ